MDIYVQKDGQKQGPFPEARIRQGIDAGEFGHLDLAWAKGKASWQPLSMLIDLDEPPPIFDDLDVPPPLSQSHGTERMAQQGGDSVDEPAVLQQSDRIASRGTVPMPTPSSESQRSAASSSETPSVDLARGEKLLYHNGSASYPVFVTTFRMQNGTHTYSLEGVSDAKLEVVYTKCIGYYGIGRILSWSVFWICLITALILFIAGQPVAWGGIIPIIIFYYFGVKESREAPWNHYNKATITIVRNGRHVLCFEKACGIHPEIVGSKNLSTEEFNQMESRLNEEINYVNSISKALSTAIATRGTNS